MNLTLNAVKRQALPGLVAGVLYLFFLILLIFRRASDSIVHYRIEPYIFGSKPIDFFFPLIVTVPFAFYTFHLKKNHILDYISLRTPKGRFIRTHILGTLGLCFVIVFLVNIIAISLSCRIAAPIPSEYASSLLKEHILGELQMEEPIVFAFLWATHKAFIGSLICLFAQISALFIENFFLAMMLPFAYVILENFFTAVLQLSRFSLTTAFVLNRLSPRAMSISHIAVAVLGFVFIILIFFYSLNRVLKNEKY